MISRPTKDQKDRMQGNLKTLITSSGYTLSQFSDFCGLSRQSINYLENGTITLTDANYILFWYVFSNIFIEDPSKIILAKSLKYVKDGE